MSNDRDQGQIVRVWCLLRDQFAHVKPVEEYFGGRAHFTYDADWQPERVVAAMPDIVVCVNDHQYEIARCLLAVRQAGIPSLVLQDGILEWRCQFENPAFGAGGGAPQHQPVLADKIACIGYQSARQIAAWGNRDKVEVTGMPRLDAMLAAGAYPRSSPGRRLIVMTAKKPWFDERQRQVTLQSLFDLRDYLATRKDIEVVWRLTRDVSTILGVENQLHELSTAEIAAALRQVDAVITTVSTTLLESMLAGRPTAALDYHNVPRFVPTAWTISARQHIEPVVCELLDPPARKMAYQKECLHDVLRCDGPAAAHVAELMEKMIAHAAQARREGAALRFPPDLLGAGTCAGAGISGVSPGKAQLQELYPNQPVFAQENPQVLQALLARADAENARLRRELETRRLGYWVSHAGKYLYRKFGRRS